MPVKSPKYGTWHVWTGKGAKRHATGKRMTAAYQKRLEGNGISHADYKRGGSVSHARGHARTPERPSDARKNPARYREYVQRSKPGPEKRRAAYEKMLDFEQWLKVKKGAIPTPGGGRTLGPGWPALNDDDWEVITGFNRDRVREAIGTEDNPGHLTDKQLDAILRSSFDDIQRNASRQYAGNPFFYK